jgi:hypothetical protein
MIPIRHASHDRLRRWRFRDRSNATGSVNIYISLHPDASSHDGSFYRGRHGPRQPLAHFAAFLLRKIDYRRCDGLHRQIRRGECLGVIARSTLDQIRVDANCGSSRHLRLSFHRLALSSSKAKAARQFQDSSLSTRTFPFYRAYTSPTISAKGWATP